MAFGEIGVRVFQFCARLCLVAFVVWLFCVEYTWFIAACQEATPTRIASRLSTAAYHTSFRLTISEISPPPPPAQQRLQQTTPLALFETALTTTTTTTTTTATSSSSSSSSAIQSHAISQWMMYKCQWTTDLTRQFCHGDTASMRHTLELMHSAALYMRNASLATHVERLVHLLDVLPKESYVAYCSKLYRTVTVCI